MEFQARQKVKVYICGKIQEVEIFSVDKKYIYFTDPTLKGVEGHENKLYSRRIGADFIESN